MGSIVPFQDLNLPPESRNSLISPKIEPKLEPFDEEHNNPYYTTTTTATNQNPNSNSTSPAPLQEFFPNSQQNDVYSEFYRISELFRTAFAKKMQSYGDVEVSTPTPDSSRAIVPHHGEEDTRVSTHVVSKAKSNQRSSEMVRVSALGIEDQRYFRDLVRRTRMLYESLRIFSVREEESGRLVGLGKRMRGDLRAASLLKEQGLWLHRDKRIIGSIPGVYVGDFFFFRMELCAVGLHGQCQAGIDFVPASQSANGEPVATSIIVSGGYEDDEDAGDVIIYTGHGGQLRHSVRQCVHQKLDGGNLALERSMFYGIEIRVIRGIKHEGSPSNKIYVYDGLYRVVDSWFDIGKSGFGVYKYKLVRMADQPVMGSTFFKFAADVRKSPLTARPTGYLSLDISNGKENWPVLLYNDIDSDQGPMFYEYLAKSVYPPFAFAQMNNGSGCECIGGCTEGNCYCAQRNGGAFAYDRSGILVRGKPVIFECGKFCSCPPSCQNRVSQKGVKHRLEVFRSRETGWGVRPLDMIPAGSFICEYTGVVLTRQQSVVLSMNGDSLIYPNRFPEKWAEWGDLSQVFSEFVRPLYPSIPPLEFAMDVSRMRNVACYFSQSSSPNVVVQYVLYDHNNVMYPHVMLFAVENIPPLRELSLDYGVADSDEWEGKLAICN